MPAKRKWFPSQIEDAINALRMLRRGEPIGRRQEDLNFLTRQLGLSRPIETYAPRTQRRYIKAAREHHTAAQARATEQTTRRANRIAFTQSHGGLTATQWRTIDHLRQQVTALGVDVDPYMDDPVIIDFAMLYGYEYLRTILTQQIDSTTHYLNGDRAPGRARWDARGELEQRFAASSHVYYIRGSDPYYYYHGRK